MTLFFPLLRCCQGSVYALEVLAGSSPAFVALVQMSSHLEPPDAEY